MIDDQENIRRINANLPVAVIEDGRLKFILNKTCAICGNEIINHPKKQQKRTRYCSEKCGLIANKKMKVLWRKSHG